MTETPLYLERLTAAVGAPHARFADGRAVVRPGSATEIVDILRVAREAQVGAAVGAAPITVESRAATIATSIGRMRSVAMAPHCECITGRSRAHPKLRRPRCVFWAQDRMC